MLERLTRRAFMAVGMSAVCGTLLAKEKYSFGQSDAYFDIREKPGQDIVYISLHDNENVAVEAGRNAFSYYGGKFIELSYSGKREIRYTSESRAYTFDPNRIFTEEGRKATLEQFKSYDNRAMRLLEHFANYITGLIGTPNLVLALHNNAPDGFSVNSYSPVILRGKDPDDFVLTTDRELFKEISFADMNICLNEKPLNDGSLAYYCKVNGIRYANCEAQHGPSKEPDIDHKVVQEAMIHDLIEANIRMNKSKKKSF